MRRENVNLTDEEFAQMLLTVWRCRLIKDDNVMPECVTGIDIDESAYTMLLIKYSN